MADSKTYTVTIKVPNGPVIIESDDAKHPEDLGYAIPETINIEFTIPKEVMQYA